MARQPKHHRIRVHGRQREDIDLDLLMQALILIGEDRARRQEEEATDQKDHGGTAQAGAA